MARDIYSLANMTISKKMTRKQLQNYIREATRTINKSLGEIEGNEVLETSLNRLKDASGVKSRAGKLGMGLGKKKDDLLRQARMLKGHFGLDIYTSNAKEYINEKTQKAYESFKKTTKDEDISFDMYNDLVEIFGGLDSTIFEILGSEQIRLYYVTYYKYGNTKTLTDLITEIYNDHKNDIINGRKITKKQMRSVIGRELRKMYKKK